MFLQAQFGFLCALALIQYNYGANSIYVITPTSSNVQVYDAKKVYIERLSAHHYIRLSIACERPLQ